MSMFDGKKILITGGTGSLGQSLTEKLLEYDVDTIRIFSRNESKQVEMESKFSEKRLRFLIGHLASPPTGPTSMWQTQTTTKSAKS